MNSPDRVWDRPIGPDPVGIFEVNIFTPARFWAFVAWLVINRGPLSALMHSNADDNEVSASPSLACGLLMGIVLRIELQGDYAQRAT